MNNSLVSCIVPVMNGERFIGEAIASILAQTHREIEVIVIDDGSTDGTEQAVRKASDSVVYQRQANAGPPAARNRGMQLAQGAFLAFLDADDRWVPQKLEKQLAMMLDQPAAECVLARVKLFWEALENEQAAFRHDNREETIGFAFSTMLARRSLIERLGEFRADLPHAAAVEWFERANAQGVIIPVVPEVLVEHRMHRDSYSRTQRATSHDEFLHLVKRSMDRKRVKPPAE